jgi:hypothetical protein
MQKQPLRIFSAILLLGIAGSVGAGELDGRWPCGKWIDTNTGHEGPLKARFHQIDDCHYRVVFTGKFAKVIPFRFATTLNVVGKDGDKVVMAGETRLMGFYKFKYDAVADEHQFNAQYSSRRWTGEFNLSR